MDYNLKEYLFLFDIDKTLLDTKGDAKKTFFKTFEDLFNIKIKDNISFRGGIDNQFFKFYYEKYNFDKKEYEFYWDKFKSNFVNNLKNIDKSNWIIYPNVYETIEFLSKRSNIALTTGNIKDGAIIKLETFDLMKFFNCGSFGDIFQTRTEIVKNCIEISKKFFDIDFEPTKIFLFGDTSFDIISGKENNIMTILVDTNNEDNKDDLNSQPNFYGKWTNINIFFNLLKNGFDKNKINFFNKEFNF